MSKLSIVMYSDGGCRPNPGVGGYGAFGYAYKEENNITKGSTPTNCYITNKGLLTEGELICKNAIKVTPEFYFTLRGSIKDSTNNIAEVYAWIETMKCLREEIKNNNMEIGRIYLKTDSQYLIHLIHKSIEMKENDGIFPDNVLVERTKELLKLVYDVRMELESLGVKIGVDYVKGHSGSLGNDIVDSLSTMSIMNHLSSRDKSGTTFNILDGKTFWDNKFVIEPYFRFKQLIFETNQDRYIRIKDSNYKGYVVFDYNKEREVGERTSENIYGMVFVKKGIKVIEDIKRFYSTYDKKHYSCCTIDVNAINHHSIASFYETYGDLVFTLPSECNVGNVRTYFKGQGPIIYNLNSGALCKMAVNKTTALIDVLTVYLNGAYTKAMANIDITDKIYALKGKKYKLNVDRTAKDMFIDNPFGERPIVLSFGSDIPNTIWMNSVVQYEPTVNLFVIKENSAIKYYSIFQMNDDTICIFCNFYSGITFL